MDKIYHRVVLAGDIATAPDETEGVLGTPNTLNLGRAGNNGIHVLRMELAQDWKGLVVKAAFRTPSGCYPALMNENNEIAVPAGVTAQATSALLGLISFDGTDAEGRARAGNLLYYVEDAGCPACPTPPDPDIWQMLVQMFIAAMPKQATADTLGTVKAQPVEEQGGRAPVVILPNGMLLAPAGAGSGSYNDLEDKPRINGNELIGNKTWQQLGFPDVEAFADAAAQSAREAQTAAGAAGSAASAASSSATAAQGSASTASTKASEAGTSAQAAAQSASAAEQSKTAAAGSASDASQSAQRAADSAGAAASDAARAEAAANKIPTPAGSADAGKFVAVNSAGDGYELQTGGGGGGITNKAKTLLISILRNAAYETDQSSNIDALAKELNASEITTYSVKNVLTNVTSSNQAATVNEGDAYSATLTANEGYTLSIVTVKMGEQDITATAYSGGSINIESVTGDIVITATAEQAGSDNLIVFSECTDDNEGMPDGATVKPGEFVVTPFIEVEPGTTYYTTIGRNLSDGSQIYSQKAYWYGESKEYKNVIVMQGNNSPYGAKVQFSNPAESHYLRIMFSAKSTDAYFGKESE